MQSTAHLRPWTRVHEHSSREDAIQNTTNCIRASLPPSLSYVHPTPPTGAVSARSELFYGNKKIRTQLEKGKIKHLLMNNHSIAHEWGRMRPHSAPFDNATPTAVEETSSLSLPLSTPPARVLYSWCSLRRNGPVCPSTGRPSPACTTDGRTDGRTEEQRPSI